MALAERFREIPGVNFNETKHGIVTAVTDILIPEVHLVGDSREHLEELRELIKQGIPSQLWPRHISNIDAGAIYKMLVDEGYDDIANNLVYILGNRLKLNLFRPLTDAYPHITVWSPRDPAITEEQIEEKGAMNELATKATKEVLARGGTIVVFAQGGREKGDRFKHYETGTGGYLSMTHGETAVFPLALDETDKILVPAPKRIIDKIPHIHSPVMHLGESISTNYLRGDFSTGTVDEVYSQRVAFIHGRLMEGQGKIKEYQEQIRLYTE